MKSNRNSITKFFFFHFVPYFHWLCDFYYNMWSLQFDVNCAKSHKRTTSERLYCIIIIIISLILHCYVKFGKRTWCKISWKSSLNLENGVSDHPRSDRIWSRPTISIATQGLAKGYTRVIALCSYLLIATQGFSTYTCM